MFNIFRKSPIIVVSFIATISFSFAQTSNISGIINVYAEVLSVNSSGCMTQVTVSDASGFNIGDTVLIIQMKGANIDLNNDSTYGDILSYDDAGNFEFASVNSIVGNTITLNEQLTRTYDPLGSVQLISVPQYVNVNVTGGLLTCQPWNGTTGGVLVFEAAGTVTLNDSIYVSGMGFRGGVKSLDGTPTPSGYDYFFTSITTYAGMKGEAIAEPAPGLGAGRGAPANGGGGGNHVNGGGAGGGNWGGGGAGGNAHGFYPGVIGGKPGKALDSAYINLNKIFLGGGGGGGEQNNLGSTDGTNGGGIVIITANQIDGNGNYIVANGINNTDPYGIDGAGGGGAGGAVLLDINITINNLNVECHGGNGGDNDNFPVGSSDPNRVHGPGGGGGGGVIFMNQSFLGVTADVSGGMPGVGLPGNFNHGATPGDTGAVITTLLIPEALPGPLAIDLGNDTAICQGDIIILTVSGGTDYLWSTGDTTASIAVIPTVTTTYSVTVSDTVCSGSVTDSIIVTVDSMLAVSIVGNNIICNGDSTILIASGGITYQWSGGSTATTPSIIVSPSSTTLYIVQTGSGNCLSPPDSITVFVLPMPVISVTEDTVICEGDTVILTASGGINYQWSGGSTATTSSIIVNPSFTTLYIVQTSSGSCVSPPDSVTVSVLPLPIVSVTGDTIICQGGTVTLTASGGVNYQWSGGSTATTSSIIVNPSFTTLYIVQTGSGNCLSPPDSVTVSVLPMPIISVTEDTVICEGDTVILTASGGINYQWSGDMIASTSSITVSPSDTSVYIVEVDNGICTALPDTVTVQVVGVPVVSIVGDTLLCDGDSAVISASGAMMYQWSGGVPDTVSYIIVSPGSTTTYTVVPYNGGCAGEMNSITVEVLPMPLANFNAPLSCDLTTVFINMSSGATGYLWDFGDGNTSIAINPSHTYGGASSYTVTLTTDPDSFCTDVSLQTIIVNNPPQAQFDIYTENCDPALFFVNSSASASSFLWDFGDGGSSTMTNPTHEYSASGDYTAVLVINAGTACPDTFQRVITYFVDSLLDIFIPRAFTPNADGLNDRFVMSGLEDRCSEKLGLLIFNRWGEIVYETEDATIFWDGTHHGAVVPNDVYVYVLKGRGITLKRVGIVTVLR